jgi:hypothetical protein
VCVFSAKIEMIALFMFGVVEAAAPPPYSWSSCAANGAKVHWNVTSITAVPPPARGVASTWTVTSDLDENITDGHANMTWQIDKGLPNKDARNLCQVGVGCCGLLL